MVRDMTEGRPIRLILSFFFPLLIGNLFQQMYNMADSIIVGQIVGKDALAAVGATGSFNFLVLGFALGLCSGLCIPVSQHFGAGDMYAMRRALVNAIYITLGVTAVITAAMLVFTRPMLRVMRTPENIFEQSYDYIIVIFGGTFATLLYNLPAGLLRALGDSKTPLLFLIIASLLNIALDLLFILAFHMGVAGAAWATVIAQAVSGALCIRYIVRHFPVLRPEKGEWKFDAKSAGRGLAIGIPMGLQFSLTAVGSVVLQSAVNTLGSDAVAAITAGSKVQMIMTQPMEALGATMATYCGQNLGAKRVDRIRWGLRTSLLLGAAYTVVAMLVSFRFGSTISLLFIKAEETQLLQNIDLFLACNAAGFVLLMALLVLRNALQGLGYSMSAMLAGIFEMVARALVAFAFVAPFGYGAVCFANPLAWLFACFLLIPMIVVRVRQLGRRFPGGEEGARLPDGV